MKLTRILSIVPIVALMLPIFASAATVAQQPDSSVVIQVYPPAGTMSAALSSSTAVLLGKPFSSDTTIQGLRFYMDLEGYDFVPGSLANVGLYYADQAYAGNDNEAVCTAIAPTSALISSVGTTSVSVGNQMSLVEINCRHNSGGAVYFPLIDHTRPLSIQFWKTGHNTTANTKGSAGGAMYYEISGDGSYSVNTTTRIDTTTPSNGQTIATSTAATIGATGYVNTDDYSDGMTLNIKYRRDSDIQAAVACTECLFTKFSFPISGSGPFTFSTTSSITDVGRYSVITTLNSTSLIDNVLNFLGFGQFASNGLLTSTSTYFYAARPSAYDVLVASSSEAIASFIASTTVNTSVCTSFTGFSLFDCMGLILLPQPTQIADTLAGFRDQVFSYAPIGYLTRFVVIISGNATTSIPIIDISLPLGDPSSPAYFTDHFVLDPNDMLRGGSDLISNVHTTFGDDKTLRQVVEPVFEIALAVGLIAGIFYDLLHIGNRRKVKTGKLR